MLFSVIVPVFNVENHLNECIESILLQDYSDYEVILVDDGSTDRSADICEKWAKKDKRIRVIHQKNGGISVARNIGIMIAKGKYIVCIDSDDYIYTNTFFSELKRQTVDNPDVIVFKFCKYYEKEKRLENCKFSFPKLNSINDLSDKINYLVKTDSFYCSAWSKAIRRELMVLNNIKFEESLLGEDQDWYYYVLLKSSTMVGIDKAFIVYRQRENSITSSFGIKNLKDNIYILRKWCDCFHKTGEVDNEYEKALLQSLAKLYCNLLIAYCRLDRSEKKAYFNDIKEMAYLFKYNLNPRVRKMSLVYKVLGFDGLMCCLNLACKLM